MAGDHPDVSAQENFLCLLCFSVNTAVIVRGQVDVDLFESSVYRDIAKQAVGYLDTYKEPIGQHLPDVFENILEGDDERKARLYRDVILHLKGLHDEGLNEQYCLNELDKFVRSQSFKKAIVTAAESMQAGDIEEAETAIDNYWKREKTSFSPGTFLNDTDNITSFLHVLVDTYPTGIPYFNKVQVGLERKTVLTIMAPSGRGKSWGLIHLGKQAAMHRLKVVHITLENGDEKTKQRYVQSFLSIARREAEQEVIRFEKEKNGALSGINNSVITRPTLRDEGIESLIKRRAEKIARKLRLVIKEFPTNALTMRGLESYLDSLDRQYNFQPDVLVLDYVDLMQVSTENLRLDLGVMFKDFRRICIERNMAGATASQTNRSGEDAKVVTAKHIGEDYSKVQTSDRIITYNQTEYEKSRGLARLFVAKNRDEEDKGMVVVSQNYATGQFALDSALLSKFYRTEILERSFD